MILRKKVELILRTQAEEINWNLMPYVLFPSNLEITRFFLKVLAITKLVSTIQVQYPQHKMFILKVK